MMKKVISNLKSIEEYSNRCGCNNGIDFWTNQPCEQCEKGKARTVKLALEAGITSGELDDEMVVDVSAGVGIPAVYRAFPSTLPDISADLPSPLPKGFTREMATATINRIRGIEEDLLNRTLKKGAFLHIPQYDFIPVVYHLMKQAISKGLKVMPYATLRTLHQIESGNSGGEDNSLSFDDYINADVCFVRITTRPSGEMERILQDLYFEREQAGKTLYIISEHPLNRLGYWRMYFGKYE